MDHAIRLKRLKFRSWHRGTKEADLMIGGFFDAHGAGWTPDQLDWFEALLEEQVGPKIRGLRNRPDLWRKRRTEQEGA